jgi:hypothetical protein
MLLIAQSTVVYALYVVCSSPCSIEFAPVHLDIGHFHIARNQDVRAFECSGRLPTCNAIERGVAASFDVGGPTFLNRAIT